MNNYRTRKEDRIRTSTRAAGCPTGCGAVQTGPAVLGRVDSAIEVASSIVDDNKEKYQ